MPSNGHKLAALTDGLLYFRALQARAEEDIAGSFANWRGFQPDSCTAVSVW